MSKPCTTSRIATTTAMVALITLAAGASSVLAQDRGNLSRTLTSLARSLEAQEQDLAIARAFRDLLNREPNATEMRRYRNYMHDEHWTERDVRRDIESRGDYRRHSSQSSGDVDRIIRRAYEDVLHRAPDQDGLRNYRRLMSDERWTEHDVRQALRKSTEHDARKEESADRIVRRAYQDILKREPDYNGLIQYRNQVLSHGWDEHDVREARQKSPEYRQRNAMTRDKAVVIVQRAYLNVLHREADAGGIEGYVQRVLRDHWNEADVARELRHSDEYRSKHR